ncbi:MAG: uroporphyrinogen-III C-methyltransferase [Alphaproteobacteria bacterium]|nr:uroporphyrinogen-III C-methyltransferase [Alphaproteobacteria bacterium]
MSRKPTKTRVNRIEPLARLPVFFGLKGRRVIVAGGSEAAGWKAELLAAAGARVELYAESPSEELRDVLARLDDPNIIHFARPWSISIFKGAALAILATENDAEAQAFRCAAIDAGISCNVVDRPAFCDFSFGGIVNRSPLVIGISTDGAAPVFGQAVRTKIEALLPQGLARWAEAAQSWRPSVQALSLSFQKRRAFWERFTALALSKPNEIPRDEERDQLLAESVSTASSPEKGSAVLVGAGPGDPELMTLKAVRALQSADIVLYDDLVSRAVLDFARREAKTMLVGKTGHGPSCKQEDINRLMVSFAQQGKRVIRLKSGDPMVFGRATEEIDACRAAGIPVEVIPGITTAQGVASRLLKSLTHRAIARRVQFLTGHDNKGQLPPDIDWRAIADDAATTVVYMPARTIRALTDAALAHGLPASTPAIAVYSATCADEDVIEATIASLADCMAEKERNGPVIVLIGRTMEGAGSNWESLLPSTHNDAALHKRQSASA